MQKPNIIYIHSHDTGRYIQPYGHAVATPNLQRLAEQGVIFRQAHCVDPTCSPSRAALLTGCYTHENGMLGLAHCNFRLNDYGQHLLHVLKRGGYHTALAGHQHIVHEKNVEQIGYDEIVNPDPYFDVREAADWLRQPEREEKPFLLSVGFVETHREFPQETPHENPNYCLPPAPLPDTPLVRQDMARFKESARILDEKIGCVLDALDESGLTSNTLVIATTDHGIPFPRMKCNLNGHGCGVYLILRGPGGFAGGKAIDALVSHLDIYPTVCDLAGVERPPWLRGESMLPLATGEAEEIHDAIFSEVNVHSDIEPMRAVRTKRFNYIRRYSGRTTPLLANCNGGESKEEWVSHDWAAEPVAEEELYDLVFDPCESHNLASDLRHAHTLDDMRNRLDRWMQETNDPLRPDGEGLILPENALIPARDFA